MDRIPIKIGAVASQPIKIPVIALLTLIVGGFGVWVTYTSDQRTKRTSVCEQFVVEGRGFWQEYVKFTKSVLARGQIEDELITKALKGFQSSLQSRHRLVMEAGARSELSFNKHELAEIRKFVKGVDQAKAYAWTAVNVPPRAWNSATLKYLRGIKETGRQNTGQSFTDEIDAFCVPK